MKREDVFERLEPPPVGLAGLRERMNERPSSVVRFRRLVPVGAAIAIAAVVLLFWSRRTTSPDLVAAARQHGGLDQVALGLAPSPGAPAALTEDERATTALAEVPTSNPRVAFYWVSSTGGPE